MKVVVNGEKKEFTNEMNLSQLLKTLELPTERIAIELNKDVVRKKDWQDVQISDQDKIEIIHFVGGG